MTLLHPYAQTPALQIVLYLRTFSHQPGTAVVHLDCLQFIVKRKKVPQLCAMRNFTTVTEIYEILWCTSWGTCGLHTSVPDTVAHLGTNLAEDATRLYSWAFADCQTEWVHLIMQVQLFGQMWNCKGRDTICFLHHCISLSKSPFLVHQYMWDNLSSLQYR